MLFCAVFFAIILNLVSEYFETLPIRYCFTTFAFHLKEVFVIEPLWMAYMYAFIFIHNIYCCQTLSISACALCFLLLSRYLSFCI